MQQLITRARRWWNEKPRQIKLLTYTLLPTGFALFGGGLWLDHSDWWTGHDYLLNIYSGFSGACFGVPAALLLFNQLANAQDEARQAALARARAGLEAALFQQDLLSLFTATDLADLTTRAAALHDQITHILTLPNDASRAQARGRFLTDFDVLLPPPAGRPRHTFRAFTDHYSVEWAPVREWRTRVQSRWNILHTEVRPSLPSNGWIADAPATAAQQAVGDLLRAGRNPWRADRDTSDTAAVKAMQYFLRDVEALCQAAVALGTYR